MVASEWNFDFVPVEKADFGPFALKFVLRRRYEAR
jgi:hypothetical protein